MLAALTYSSLSALRPEAEPIELDPGIITLLARLIGYVRARFSALADAEAAELIATNGGRLTDSLERQIGGRFA